MAILKPNMLRNIQGADSGSGGGAPPAATPPLAQGAAAIPADLGTTIKEMVSQAMKEAKDTLFADARRAGLLGKGKSTGSETTDGAQQHPAAPATPAPSMTATDVQTMVQRQLEFSQAIANAKLPPTAAKRIEAAFLADGPENVAEWVKGYLGDLGLGGSQGGNPSTPSSTQPNQVANGQAPPRQSVVNVPAPGSLPSGEIMDPYALTEADVQAMYRQHGTYKTGQLIWEALKKAPPRSFSLRRR